jgi:hypothetical protein
VIAGGCHTVLFVFAILHSCVHSKCGGMVDEVWPALAAVLWFLSHTIVSLI